MDDCLARRCNTGTRVKNRVQRAVQISQRVVDGRGSRDTEGEGEGFRKQLYGGMGIDNNEK